MASSPNTMNTARSPRRAARRSSMTFLTTVRRSTALPSTTKSCARIEPEMSMAIMKSRAGYSPGSRLIHTGRASAITNNAQPPIHNHGQRRGVGGRGGGGEGGRAGEGGEEGGGGGGGEARGGGRPKRGGGGG